MGWVLAATLAIRLQRWTDALSVILAQSVNGCVLMCLQQDAAIRRKLRLQRERAIHVIHRIFRVFLWKRRMQRNRRRRMQLALYALLFTAIDSLDNTAKRYSHAVV